MEYYIFTKEAIDARDSEIMQKSIQLGMDIVTGVFDISKDTTPLPPLPLPISIPSDEELFEKFPVIWESDIHGNEYDDNVLSREAAKWMRSKILGK